jgi:GT2 family glycosyltransferase
LIKSSIPIKIIVIDNNSSDNTVQTIKSKYEQVELLELKRNLGFGKANNIGLKKVFENDAEFAFLLNQDAWIEKDTVSKLINAFQKHTEFVLMSPIHLNGKGDNFDHNFISYCSIQVKGRKFFFDLLKQNSTDDVIPASFVNAACWLISRNCIEKVGGFNPVFPHYGEDSNYFQRISYLGLKAGICTNSFVYHDRDITAKKKSFKSDILYNYVTSFLVPFCNPSFNPLFIFINQMSSRITSGIINFFSFKYKLFAGDLYYIYLIFYSLFQAFSSRKEVKRKKQLTFLQNIN